MTLVQIISQKRLPIPLIALSVATAVGVGLVATRTLLTWKAGSLYLVWNLCLAWLPLVFALCAFRLHELGRIRGWRFAASAGAWMLFFPNAPYIFTDLIHLTTRHRATVWTDLVLIALFSVTGLLLGFLSLYLMQSLVTRRAGRVAGWLFVALSAGMGSVGIYIGRFLRWNSWDAVINPWNLAHDIGSWLLQLPAQRHGLVFPVLFAAFLFLAYAMLYSLTHLHPVEPAPAATESERDFA